MVYHVGYERICARPGCTCFDSRALHRRESQNKCNQDGRKFAHSLRGIPSFKRMLLIGPPGSGKTHRVLAAFQAALASLDPGRVKLIVPTASMAEHLRHQMARLGMTIPP